MKLNIATAAVLMTLASRAALAASEGGDTWSDLQPQPLVATDRTTSDRPVVVATTANLSNLRSEQPNPAYGTPVQDSAADRIVRLGPGSQWVNVAYGETVQFIVPGGESPERSFVWRFDVMPEVTQVDLSKVAPAQFLDHEVQVFVGPNPLYNGD